jgi:hypothetical protein
MNDLRRIELKDSSTKSRPSATHTGRKIAIGLLAILIFSAMIVWVSFLGWGIIAMMQSLLNHIGAFF